MLAEVEIIGRLNCLINFWQNSSDATRMASVLSSGIRFLATLIGLSYIIVVGLSANSTISKAASGIS